MLSRDAILSGRKYEILHSRHSLTESYCQGQRAALVADRRAFFVLFGVLGAQKFLLIDKQRHRCDRELWLYYMTCIICFCLPF